MLADVLQKTAQEQDIFDALGAGNIPEEEKGALLSQILLLIHQRVFMRVMHTLPEDAVKKLEAEAEQNEASQSHLEEVIEQYVPNYSELYEEEARKVRHELIAKVATV